MHVCDSIERNPKVILSIYVIPLKGILSLFSFPMMY